MRVITLNVVIPSVVMLSVVAPQNIVVHFNLKAAHGMGICMFTTKCLAFAALIMMFFGFNLM
jgi:hypothetical protein